MTPKWYLQDSLDEERYFVPFPLVGEYIVYQPFIIFGIAKVIVSMNFVFRNN